MPPKKPRIYDLSNAILPPEEDEKVRKQKQTDLNKQLTSICASLGYSDKSTANSSLDDALIEQIINELNKEGQNLNSENLIKKTHEIVNTKKTTKKTSEKKTEEKVEEPKKKILRIVRRIKPGQLEQEQEEKEKKEAEQQSTPITNLHPARPIPISDEKPEEPKQKEELKKEEVTKVPEKKVESARKANLSLSKINQTKEKLETKSPQSLQPFRVARPTMVPSMMGRTKRPTKRSSQSRNKEKERKEIKTESEKPEYVYITSQITVKDLAAKLLLPETEVIKALFSKGIIRTVNQMLEHDIAVELAEGLEYVVFSEEDKKDPVLQPDISKDHEDDLEPRPPIVTIMGHVDHGKTTLLDAIREAKFNVTEQEKGGITQHIGAYQIEINDYDGKSRKITFLDTPGHEAFTLMRARGAQLTDIAILVVAADDGVMPQTIEAINHAQSAEVPIIIALNKIDKEGSQPDRVLGELAERNLLVEDYGGTTVCSKVSAKEKQNLDDLLTKITLVADAELQEKLRANPEKPAEGVIIEAELSKERGPVVDLLVHGGTLKKGDCLVAGTVAGRVRAMFDDHGNEITVAPPSTPVEIIGLPTAPHAGDLFQVYGNYQEAKKVAEEKHHEEKEKRKSLGLMDFASKVKEGQAHELKVIIKSDVHGSAEAVAKEISKLSTNDILIKPIHIGSGNISENDINLAASSEAIVVGFHVGMDGNAQRAKTDLGVDVRLYDIIYKITEDLEKAMLGMLEPEKEEVKLGVAEVRQLFTFGKGNKIAGSYVTEGKLKRSEIARLIRNGETIFEGKIDNLKRFKEDAKEVQTNFECGISFIGYNDLQEGDIIECWTIVEKERTKL